MEGEKNMLENFDASGALAEFARLGVEEEKLSREKTPASRSALEGVVEQKQKLFQELLRYGMKKDEIFREVDKVRNELEREK